jgi:hypothetical protein
MVVDARMNSVCLRWLQQWTRSLGGCQLSVRARHLRPSFPLALLALKLLLIRQVRSPPVISPLPFWLFLLCLTQKEGKAAKDRKESEISKGLSRGTKTV